MFIVNNNNADRPRRGSKNITIWPQNRQLHFVPILVILTCKTAFSYCVKAILAQAKALTISSTTLQMRTYFTSNIATEAL